eukprot:gnl/MRDRNA2_/MRDRNA2_109106_c0_seq1.p1 gnl/MRDRNA2_/MRDRNA2_109106_c0~~gnl/MRDRNA2_/MRDRNA2_109106_c0_seq1.p1  ORF type:complete len:565 (+),score=164.82 gnl/MRDRNA2_/MRDRNA2_109106_c0_seq1:222-1916(+)
MQLVGMKRFPGEVLLLALAFQMLGSYFSVAIQALLANGCMIVGTLVTPGLFSWGSKSDPKHGRKASKITKPASPPTSNKSNKVSASKKVQELTAVPLSSQACRVTTPKKSQEEPTAAVKGTVTKTEATAQKVESRQSLQEDMKAIDKDLKEKMPKKKQRSKNSSHVEQQQEPSPAPTTPPAPAPAEPKQMPLRKGKAAFSPGAVDVIMDMMEKPEKKSEPKVSTAAAAQSPLASKQVSAAPAPMPAPPALVSREQEPSMDWVDYWNEQTPKENCNVGRETVIRASPPPTQSKCEIAIQTVTEVEVQTETPPGSPPQMEVQIEENKMKVEKKKDLSESLARLPSLGLVPATPPPSHPPQMKREQKKAGPKTKPPTAPPTQAPKLPQEKPMAQEAQEESELELAAKFEEEARLLEEEARKLEEEAKRFMQQASQKASEVAQEMAAVISDGSDTEAKPISRASSVRSVRWADIEDQEDQWDDEAAFAIIGNMVLTDKEKTPMTCPDFLNFGSCPRGACCPWQPCCDISEKEEEVDCEDLKGATRSAEEVLYKRGMLYPMRTPKKVTA